VLRALEAFVPLAALLAVTPGPATALVVGTAARGGRRRAFVAMAGNASGLAAWALASTLGISALVAASEGAFAALRLSGAVVLVVLGIRALRGARRPEPVAVMGAPSGGALRDGLVTALANPKVALFYVVLVPQFVPDRAPVLPATLALASVQIAFGFAWYAVLVVLVARLREGYARRRARIEAATGIALIAFGLALTAERR
jgi:threonine/homoserine/homoserine lactone efflux protein